MSLTQPFQLLSQYNARMNTQILNAIAGMPDDVLLENKGAFFHSILGTLNHILVGDILWLNRFYQQAPHRYRALDILEAMPRPTSLDACLFDKLENFSSKRIALDKRLALWIAREISQTDLAGALTYTNTAG